MSDKQENAPQTLVLALYVSVTPIAEADAGIFEESKKPDNC